MTRTKIEIKAVWAECPDCDEYWCNLHQQHAHDCICPPIGTWLDDVDNDPYSYTIPVVIMGDEDEE